MRVEPGRPPRVCLERHITTGRHLHTEHVSGIVSTCVSDSMVRRRSIRILCLVAPIAAEPRQSLPRGGPVRTCPSLKPSRIAPERATGLLRDCFLVNPVPLPQPYNPPAAHIHSP